MASQCVSATLTDQVHAFSPWQCEWAQPLMKASHFLGFTRRSLWWICAAAQVEHSSHLLSAKTQLCVGTLKRGSANSTVPDQPRHWCDFGKAIRRHPLKHRGSWSHLPRNTSISDFSSWNKDGQARWNKNTTRQKLMSRGKMRIYFL